jgi:hypothetical protein
MPYLQRVKSAFDYGLAVELEWRFLSLCSLSFLARKVHWRRRFENDATGEDRPTVERVVEDKYNYDESKRNW